MQTRDASWITRGVVHPVSGAPLAPVLEEGLLKRRTIQRTMKTNLITGGAGFIGSHLLGEATRRGLRVRVLDNLETGKIADISTARARLAYTPLVDFEEGLRRSVCARAGGRRAGARVR